jgi:uncharacterized phage-associated protein
MSLDQGLNTYTPGAVVNFFLDLSKKSETPITPMQLQKLLYFAQGWYLAKFNKSDKIVPLINEPFQAWDYGPVSSSVYHEFKRFGSHAIDEVVSMTELEISKNSLNVDIVVNNIPQSDETTIKHLENIWNRYSQYSARELSDMTHTKDPENPWILTREVGAKEGIARGKEISNLNIRTYFSKLKSEGREY